MEKSRHLRAIECIDQGLREAEDISVVDGIRHAINEGRMSHEEGEACIQEYKRTRIGLLGLHEVERPEPPDAAA